jgi:hypothetical protein
MLKLKKGIFASVGSSIITNIGKWLLAANSGKLWSSNNETSFQELETTIFENSNVNHLLFKEKFYNEEDAYFAAGNDGKIAKSSDLISWTTINAETTKNIKKININKQDYISGYFWESSTLPFSAAYMVYGNNIWLATTNTDLIYKSSDTITWTTQNSNFGNTIIRYIAYGNGIWTAVGDAGQIRTSTDTITWATQNSNFEGSQLLSVAYGNGIWIAVGARNQIILSYDSQEWTPVNSNSNIANSVVYGNGVWAISGGRTQEGAGIRYSTNGIVWINPPSVPVVSNFAFINSMAYGNNLWIIASSYGSYSNLKPVIFSTDAINWTRGSLIPSPSNPGYVQYGNGLYTLISLGLLYISTDGFTWERPRRFSGGATFSTYGDNKWISISGNTINRSVEIDTASYLLGAE